MTSNSLFTKSLPFAAMAAAAGMLAGCSTVKSISPFGSNVPYAQDVQPVMPKPAVSEIPAFKPKPKPEVSVSEAPTPAAAPPAPSSPAPAPSTTPAPPAAVPPPAAAPAPPSPSPPPPPPAPQSSAAPPDAPKIAETRTPAAAPPDKAKAPAGSGESSDDSEVAGESGKRAAPALPDADHQFKDDGTYPNLAQVPARPVNMPTFAEAKVLEKSLVADQKKAKDASPASPDAPAVDSTPVPVSKLAMAGPAPAPPTPTAVDATARAEDQAPCLSGKPADGDPTATLHFETGSAALTSANLAVLADVMPTIRAAKGTIRIFGHGDTETNAATGTGRFDLAAARAGAVAQAVAGYGIPVPRIAVGVACSDAAFAGASVQLYAES
jgi:outer membrane protein OmpA-like peptidoglycan-associated protein